MDLYYLCEHLLPHDIYHHQSANRVSRKNDILGATCAGGPLSRQFPCIQIHRTLKIRMPSSWCLILDFIVELSNQSNPGSTNLNSFFPRKLSYYTNEGSGALLEIIWLKSQSFHTFLPERATVLSCIFCLANSVEWNDKKNYPDHTASSTPRSARSNDRNGGFSNEHWSLNQIKSNCDVGQWKYMQPFCVHIFH